MSAMDRQLLAQIAKVPAGEKLPVSAFARTFDATVSVVMSAVQGLVDAGKLDAATLRPPAAIGRAALLALLATGPVHSRTIAARQLRAVADVLVAEGVAERCAPPGATTNFKNMLRLVAETQAETPPGKRGQEAGALPTPATTAPDTTGAEKVGGGEARSNDAAPADRPSGAQLVERIEAEARRRGTTAHAMVTGIVTMHAKTWLDQLREAKRPKALTVERVEALIAGRPVPKGQGATSSAEQRMPRAEREALGLPPSRRMEREEISLANTAQERAHVDELRQASELARIDRQPGETLADRIRRCGREVDAEEVGEKPRRRAFEPLPADRWAKLSALAVELGKSAREAMIDAIDAGILCLTEDLREDRA